MGSLSNLYISQSYKSLAHLGTDNALSIGTMTLLQDGIGQSLNISFDGTNISSSGNIYAANITASVINTGSFATTASFNAYTQSTNVRLNNLESTSASVNVSITNLNSTTQSLNTSITNLNSNSASVNTSITNLNASSASQQISINSLSAATSSYVTETESGSFLLTASFDNGTRNLTFTKGNNTTFNVNIPDVSGSTFDTGSFATTGSNTFTGANTFQTTINAQNGLSIAGQTTFGDGQILNTFSLENISGSLVFNKIATASKVDLQNLSLLVSGTFTSSLQQGYVWVGDASGKTTTISTGSFITESETGSFVTTSSFNSYTQSNNQRVSSLEVNSASVNISISNLNAATSSYANSASVAAVDAAQQQSINSINAVTASFLTASTDISALNAFTASQISFNNSATASISQLLSFSSSLDANFVTEAELAAATGSLITQINTKLDTASFNSYTASQSTASIVTSISNLNQFTQSANGRLNSLETNSASVNVSIANLNSTTSSLVTSVANLNSATQSLFSSASLGLVTASLSGQILTFTKGNGTTFDITIPDISGSTVDTGSLVTTASFNAYTQSNNQRVNSLEVNSASVNISITNVNSATASLFTSVNSLNTYTASQSTASIVNSINALNASSASQQVSIDALNVFTASQSTASIETSITNLNSFTQSANSRLNNLETTSASVNVSISNLNSTTSSLGTSVANLNSFTQSQLAVNVILAGEIDSLQAATASYAISSSVAAVDAAQQAQINSLISATSSYADSASFAASQLAQDTRINGLAAQTSSYITEAETASFARTNVNNNFTANQTFTNITAVSASFTYVQTLYETASVIYSSGSNQLGDALDDIQTLSGSVLVRGSLRVNGVPVLTSSVNISGLVTTSSFNAYTQSNNQRVSSLEVNSASVNTSISALNTFTASQSTASLVTSITNLNTFSASTLVSISNINSTTASLNTSVSNINTATASLFSSASLALVTASFDNGTRNLTFTKGNATQFSVNIPDTSGSILPNGVVSGSQQIIDLGFLQTASFNSYTQSNDSRVSSLESATASLFTSVANINTFTQSANISINALNAATSSYVTSAITASSLITASVSSSTITFTKGDASTFNITLPTASVATINTGSFATTGSNVFRGRQTISSSLTVLGDNTNDIYLFRGGVLNTADGIAITPNNIVAYSRQIEIISPDATLKLSPTLGNSNISFDTLGGLNHDIMAISGVTTNSSASLQISQANQGLIIAEYGPLKQTRFYNKVDISGSISITGSLSASLNQGYVLVGDSNNRTVLVATSSFVGTIVDTGSFVTTSSFNAYTASTDSSISQLNASSASQQVSIDALNTFTASQSTASLVTSIDNLNTFSASALVSISNLNSTTASLLVETENLELFSASALISISNLNGKTGSYATTGSNVFTGSQTFADSGSNSMTLHSVSGSLGFAQGNIDGFFNVSASFVSANPAARLGGNILLKTNTGATGSLVISGSNNLVMGMPNVNPGFRTQLTAGNLVFTNPQVSASMAFPIAISSNYLGAGLTMRGPVSSSQWTISGNNFNGTINIGSSVANNAEKAVAGLSLTNNIVNGTLTYIANRALHTQANQIANNIIGGVTTLNAASSSIIYNNNIGALTTITNIVSGSGAAIISSSNALYVVNNLFAGLNNTLTASGSSDPGDTRGLEYTREVTYNTILGTLNSVTLPYDLTGSNTIHNTLIAGLNLSITGSSPGILSSAGIRQGGSAFLGRFNANDSIRNRTSNIILAVGTGTGNGSRKTGFLIDSGSNTFVEGTLNVSGSSTFTGSLNGLTLTRGPGNNNVGIGVNILQNAVSGGNVALGTDALRDNTSGTDNVALGNSALLSNISGDRNMAIGSNTLDSNTTGTLNVAIGNATLAGLVDGNANVGIGFEALKNQITGSTNVGIGSQVLNQNISGSGNIAFGAKAGFYETGSNNFYINNTEYGSLNADRSGSLMWGTMSTTTANQTLQINATTRITNDLIVYGNKQFNVGAFQSNVSQSGSAAVSQSMNFETTDISNGISMVSNSRITLANSGTYNIQFSAQVLADTGSDTVWIWLKKNGTNVSSTSTKLLLRNNEAAVAAWNFVVEAAASDYFELAWESANGDTVLLAEAAGTNYPAVPSIILTVTQVR